VTVAGRYDAAEFENARLRDLLIQAGLDRDASDIAAKLQQVLIGELHHRVKNTLAIVSSIVSQSLRSSDSLDDAAGAISERLQALGTAHDLLLREAWTGAGLRSLVDAAILAFDAKSSDRIAIEGEDMVISSAASIGISLMLHELCTNAVKHGALSTAAGRVAITWTVDTAEARFRMTWIESHGPPVTAPARRSFGTRLIESSLPGQMKGEARIRYEPAGLVCDVNISLASLQERPAVLL